jgi:hypothetical protein
VFNNGKQKKTIALWFLPHRNEINENEIKREYVSKKREIHAGKPGANKNITSAC